MTNIKKVNIPQTCHQPWQQMVAVEDGRHCGHCCKTVVDFTTMTNEQIISYLSVKNNLCGKFNQHQLDSLNRSLIHKDQRSFLWKSILAGVSMLSMFPFFKAEAKPKYTTIQTIPSFKTLPKKDQKDTIRNFVVRGCVISEKDKLPIQNVQISVEGSNMVTSTDNNGKFTLNVPGHGNVLVVSAPGYTSQQISLTGNARKSLKIIMHKSIAKMGKIKIVK